MSSVWSILLPLIALLNLTIAANSTIPSSIYTYTSSVDGQSFTFAINIDQSKKDVYFHLSAPAGNSWVGVGFGNQMKGALMLVAYASENGTGVTVSPRTASAHSEPSYYSDASCKLLWDSDLLDGNTVQSYGYGGDFGSIIVNAVCSNITQWPAGALSTTSQDFIFAVGPGSTGGMNLHSDSLTADLRRHDAYGGFTMDLSKAVSKDSSTAGVPRPNGGNDTYTTSNASDGFLSGDNDPAPAIHGFIMCFSFVIIFPLGSLIVRALRRVIMHAVIQGIGLFLVICATAGGIIISAEYNRSKNFATAHQIFGILCFLGLIFQLGLGIVNHRIYKKTQQPTTFGKIHRYLGPAIIFLGIINAPLGFVLAQNPRLCLPYLVILLMVAILWLLVRFSAQICCRGRNKRRQQQQQQQAEGVPMGPVGGMPPGPEGYQYPQYGPGGGPAGGTSGLSPYSQAPPAYGRQPYERQASYGPGESEGVPLRPYESQASGIQNQQPVHPRPMV
ncbi:hypothetical protein BAUCODRAFT_30260 [Baudoinia panamericana UAMH 10762]|uniref:DOMON domain-containing protein n=1 Tax=Baudoinia panamericana (strain UAMH 10762) TaxID=717646 RepID=M2MSJ2_BAUPA|nr:uncharacterized protein BAUCODRAFT_30260 [Baudoinia panamericana UAMH 10762]EMC99846.1 hypothetical protein BAUCODRAFT_30260 [Baudoinia panamericana UAMH 10762]